MNKEIYLALCAAQHNCPVHDPAYEPNYIKRFDTLDGLLDYALQNLNAVRIFGVTTMSSLAKDGDESAFYGYRFRYLKGAGHVYHGLEFMVYPGGVYSSEGVLMAHTVQMPDGSGLYWEKVMEEEGTK